MRQKIVICVVAAFCLLLQSCAQKSSSQFEIIRLIDELEAENILMSPLLKLSEIDLSSNQSFPIKSFPLQDMGSGENPSQLKRKIKVWREQLNALFAPPDSRYEYQIRVNDYYCSAFTGGGFVSSVFGFADGFDSYYERTDEVLLDKAAELNFRDVARWIDSNKNKNYFLFIHTYQPHDPYACPAPYKTMFLSENSKWSHINLNGHLGGKNSIFKELPEDERQNIIDLYDAEIRYTDEKLIGPLVQKLKDMALYDQTMIIFTSDHGEEFYDHGGWGHGHSLYDESLKVPLLIKFPESKFMGSKVENIVSLVDVVPTILDEMGINSSRYELDGKSLIPILEGKDKKDRTLKAVELFDLSSDPFEYSNIVGKKSSLANSILDRIEEIYKRAKRKKTGQAILDEELKKQLRALGYIK